MRITPVLHLNENIPDENRVCYSIIITECHIKLVSIAIPVKTEDQFDLEAVVDFQML